MTATKKIAIASGVTLVVGIGGYFLYKALTKKQENEPAPAPAQTSNNNTSTGGFATKPMYNKKVLQRNVAKAVEKINL